MAQRMINASLFFTDWMARLVLQKNVRRKGRVAPGREDAVGMPFSELR
jgi:hypothetical protein